uniref:Calcineurin-binding protein cabin-1 n=2 Tax=Tetraselmis sp. GSL018 TaxID=582737 RepID=A0A061REY4_9CHLO
MYSNLYIAYMSLQDLSIDGMMLEDSGWEEVLKKEQMIRSDLSLNPSRLVSWDLLGSLYTEALEALQMEAALFLDPAAWDPCSRAAERLQLLQRRARRSWAAAAHAAQESDDTAFMEDSLGCALFRECQSVPPAADQLSRRIPRDSNWRDTLARASRAFSRATSILSDEWTFPYYMGKISAKLGAPPSSYLPQMARACHLAKVHSGGLLEPIYRLHASRLKLITENAVDADALKACARHCFLAESIEPAAELVVATGDCSMEQLRGLLVNDCLQAMAWILEKDKNFHKANYRLAVAHAALGDWAAALESIMPLFSKKGRLSFAVNIYCIASSDSSKRSGSKRRRAAKQDDKAANEEREEEWGLAPPAPPKGAGIKETDAKNRAAMRKSLLCFIALLARMGGGENLQRLDHMQRFLGTSANFKDTLKDIRDVALGYYVNLLLDNNSEQLPGGMLKLILDSIAPASSTDKGAMPTSGADAVAEEIPDRDATPERPHIIMDLEDALPSLSAEAAAMLGRSYQLHVDCLLAHNGDDQAINESLLRAFSAAKGNVRWSCAMEPRLLQAYEAISQGINPAALTGALAGAHLARLGQCGTEEDIRKALDPLRKRFKSLKMASQPVKRLFATGAIAIAIALFRRWDNVTERAEGLGSRPSQEIPNSSTGCQEQQSSFAPAEGQGTAAIEEETPVIQPVTETENKIEYNAASHDRKYILDEAFQLLKHCLALFRSPPVSGITSTFPHPRLFCMPVPLEKIWGVLLVYSLRGYAAVATAVNHRDVTMHLPEFHTPMPVENVASICEELCSGHEPLTDAEPEAAATAPCTATEGQENFASNDQLNEMSGPTLHDS